MGGNFGKLSRYFVYRAKRPIKNYNLHNRVERQFERQKTEPNPAPKHTTTVDLLKQYAEDNPQIKEELSTKNEDLVSRMNKLKLEVTGKNPEITVTNPDRPLPRSSTVYKDPLSLSEQPIKVPIGKISLVQAAEILSKHKKSPTEYSAKVIAQEYKLDLDKTYSFLQYFYSLDMEDNLLVDLLAVQQAQKKKMLIYSFSQPTTKKKTAA